MKKITPFLWFDGTAEQAAKFYVSLFKKSKIVSVMRSGASAGGKKGSVVGVTFQIDGHEYVAFNGGPHYKLTPAFSMFVSCKTQKQVDTFWRKLSKGGTELRCGWLQDKYGLSWQIIPTALTKLMQHKDRAKAQRTVEAMMKMKKLIIKDLQAAARG